jgi:hypothetical protein
VVDGTMNQQAKEEIARLVAEEQIQRDKDKGFLIENPGALLRHKMQVAMRQGEEDPAWFIRQRDRLLGHTQHPINQKSCRTCGGLLYDVTFTVDNLDYCDEDCANGFKTQFIKYSEFLRRLKESGGKTFTRHDGEVVTITYEDSIKNASQRIIQIIDAEDSFI